MSKPLDLWNKVKQPPKSALKTIGGGRLKGMTDINPMWRFEEMTKQFGQIGDGWYFEIIDRWFEDGADNTKGCFAIISLFVRHDDGEWSSPIQGVGGSMLVQKESAGLRTNDEAYKMAVTDALGTAMKMLGFGADIYAGKWDGSKYKDIKEGKGAIKPTDGAMDDLTEDEKNEVKMYCEQIKVLIDEGFEWLAHDKVYNNEVSNEMRLGIWNTLGQDKTEIDGRNILYRTVISNCHKTEENGNRPQSGD